MEPLDIEKYRDNIDAIGVYADAASENSQIIETATTDYMEFLFGGVEALREQMLNSGEDFDSAYDLDASIESVQDEVERVLTGILLDLSVKPEEVESAANELFDKNLSSDGREFWVAQ